MVKRLIHVMLLKFCVLIAGVMWIHKNWKRRPAMTAATTYPHPSNRSRSSQRLNPSVAKSGGSKVAERETAKEAASRFIGYVGLPAIVAVIGLVIYSASNLSAEALTPIVGMASGVIMALIAMLTGITGTKDKEEKPEFKVITDLITRLDQKEAPMEVKVDGDKVTVAKGHDTVTMKKDA